MCLKHRDFIEKMSDTTCCTTLRDCLDDDRQKAAFDNEPVANVPVSCQSLDHRLAAMQRGIIAHQALLELLTQVGVAEEKLPRTLRDAISEAAKLSIIGRNAKRWLLNFNDQANRAKHDANLPF